MSSPDDLRSRIQEAKADAAAIRRALDALEGRVADLEALLAEGLPSAAGPTAEAPPEPAVPPARIVLQPTGAKPPAPELLRHVGRQVAPEAESTAPRREEPVDTLPLPQRPALARMADLAEEHLGTRWFNWLGILAIIFAAAYFLKYSFEQGWITPAMRFYGGLVAGVVLLGCGHFAQKRSYPILARGFWGGGVGLLFLVFFAGFRLLVDATTGAPLIGRETAFLGMAGTAAVGAALSIVHRSRAVALLAAVGGYLTPLLLSTGRPDQLFLFVYLAILTAGFLVIGHWMRWRFMPGLCWVAVVGYFMAWWAGDYPGSPALTVVFLCLFFLLFTAETIVGSAVLRLDTGRLTASRAGVTAFLFALAMLVVLDEFYPAWKGAFALAAAVTHFAAALVIGRRQPASRGLAVLYGHAAAVLLLLSPAVEPAITTWGITVAWLGTGLLLLSAGRVAACGQARFWGLAGLGLGLGRLAAIDTPDLVRPDREGSILLSRAGLLYSIAACLLWGGYGALSLRSVRPLASRSLGAVPDEYSFWPQAERVAGQIVLVTAVALPMALLWLGMDDVLRLFVAPRLGLQSLAYEQNRGLGFTFVFTAYATLAATVAHRRHERAVVWFASAVLIATIAKMVVSDLGLTYVSVRTVLLNTRFATVAFAAACTFWLSREARRSEADPTDLRAAGPAFLVAGHLLVPAALAMEWVDFCTAHALQAPGSPSAGASAFGVAALLAVYGAALQALGPRTARRQTLMGLGITLLAAGLCIWVGQSLALEAPAPYLFVHFRFLMGAVVAGALFAAGRVWLRQLDEGSVLPTRMALATVPILAANALLLGALTLEASDFFASRASTLRLPRWLDPVYARGLSFSVIWTLYAIGMIVAGFIRAFRPVRVMALVVLMATTLKVFIFDLAFLTGLYRVLSFLTLGCILVGVAYAYQRHRNILMGIPDVPVRTADAAESEG